MAFSILIAGPSALGQSVGTALLCRLWGYRPSSGCPFFSPSSSSSSFPPSVFSGVGDWEWRVKLRGLMVEFGSTGVFCFFNCFFCCCFLFCFFVCFVFVCFLFVNLFTFSEKIIHNSLFFSPWAGVGVGGWGGGGAEGGGNMGCGMWRWCGEMVKEFILVGLRVMWVPNY